MTGTQIVTFGALTEAQLTFPHELAYAHNARITSTNCTIQVNNFR